MVPSVYVAQCETATAVVLAIVEGTRQLLEEDDLKEDYFASWMMKRMRNRLSRTNTPDRETEKQALLC